MGLNPDNLLVKMEQPQMPAPMPEEAQMAGQMPQEMSPEMSMQPQQGEMSMSEDDILTQLQAMGGSPMPGVQDGGLL
jgi:hypothetical protein